jgi:excisionase family DNA binding protein
MKLLRIEEVADRLSLKPSTIRKLIWSGQIPAVRPTKRAVRVSEEVVDALTRLGYRPSSGEVARLVDAARPSVS